MTRAEEARAVQEWIEARLGQKGLGWWYGTNCRKCCGIYPRIRVDCNSTKGLVRYECEICGKTTKGHLMPWLAAEAWNRGEYDLASLQLELDLMEGRESGRVSQN